MKVLSLFDGMSCGRIALDQLGIPVEKYYASEIDKYAIQVSQANYPDIIQVGDVCDLDPKDFKDVNLILFGSPCQGFSFAGKQLAFDDPRSKLFFEAVRLLKAIKPKYFLAENVRMKKEFLEIFTEQLSACYDAKDVAPQFVDLVGNVRFEPIFINSSLVSAQSRQRYYWTNIPNIKQPEDRGIVLRDILETEPDNFTTMSDKFVKRNGDKNCMIDQNKEKASNLSAMEYVKNGRQGDYLACDQSGKPTNKPKMVGRDNTPGHDILKRVYSEDGKSPTITAHAGKGTVPKIETKPKQVGIASDINGHDILKRVYSPEGKSPTLNTMGGGNREPKIVSGALRARSKNQDGKNVSWKETKPKQMLELRKDEKSNSITSVSKDSVVVSKIREKSKTVRSGGRASYDRHEWDSVDELHWRKLTPLECERLQTVPDNYTASVSNTQRYKMLGNGWTVNVIAHILTNMETK